MYEQTHTERTKSRENGTVAFPVDVRRVTMLTGFLLVLVLGLSSGAVLAQESQTWDDDFEDGDVEGWNGTDTYPEISSSSIEGDWSAYARSEGPDGQIEWSNGPVLDLTEEFTITATFRPNEIDPHPNQIRIGISSGSPDVEGENAYLIFDNNDGTTYLGTYQGTEPPTDSADTINDAFNNEWVTIKLESSGDGTLTAKVWRYDTEEPADPQLERNFEGTYGKFGFNVGTPEGGDPQDREAWLDSVNIEGSEAASDNLTIQTRSWLEYGQSYPYTVTWTDANGNREDVTANATVESGDPSVVSVDDVNFEISATEDENINARVQLRAEYPEADAPAITYVTVATPTLDNLDILPTFQRVRAFIGDDNITFILIAILGGVAATHLATSFAGLGFSTIIMVVGWFAGWVDTGIVMVAVFLSLFIGLNLAANIDYTMQRG